MFQACRCVDVPEVFEEETEHKTPKHPRRYAPSGSEMKTMIFVLLLCVFIIASVTAVKLTALKMYYRLIEKDSRQTEAGKNDNTI